MSPEVWREFFKEPYRKMYEYLRENGILILHHSDSSCEPIAKDMEEIVHLKRFIPGWTYGDPDTLYPHVKPLVSEAISNWNKEHYGIG